MVDALLLKIFLISHSTPKLTFLKRKKRKNWDEDKLSEQLSRNLKSKTIIR